MSKPLELISEPEAKHIDEAIQKWEGLKFFSSTSMAKLAVLEYLANITGKTFIEDRVTVEEK